MHEQLSRVVLSLGSSCVWIAAVGLSVLKKQSLPNLPRETAAASHHTLVTCSIPLGSMQAKFQARCSVLVKSVARRRGVNHACASPEQPCNHSSEHKILLRPETIRVNTCQTGWGCMSTSFAGTDHETILLGADDVYTGAAAWSSAALVVAPARMMNLRDDLVHLNSTMVARSSWFALHQLPSLPLPLLSLRPPCCARTSLDLHASQCPTGKE